MRKDGHKGTDCWTLDSNKEKRPTGYNDKNDGNKNYKFNGNSKLAWKRLSEKFAGHNNAEKMKLIKQLNESRMGKQEDPDE